MTNPLGNSVTDNNNIFAHLAYLNDDSLSETSEGEGASSFSDAYGFLEEGYQRNSFDLLASSVNINGLNSLHFISTDETKSNDGDISLSRSRFDSSTLYPITHPSISEVSNSESIQGNRIRSLSNISDSSPRVPEEPKGFISRIFDQIYNFLSSMFDWICSFFISTPNDELDEAISSQNQNRENVKNLKAELTALIQNIRNVNGQEIQSSIESLNQTYPGFKDRLLGHMDAEQLPGGPTSADALENDPTGNLVEAGLKRYFAELCQ